MGKRQIRHRLYITIRTALAAVGIIGTIAVPAWNISTEDEFAEARNADYADDTLGGDYNSPGARFAFIFDPEEDKTYRISSSDLVMEMRGGALPATGDQIRDWKNRSLRARDKKWTQRRTERTVVLLVGLAGAWLPLVLLVISRSWLLWLTQEDRESDAA